MKEYPAPIARINHVEPAPRRVRGMLATETVFDTTHAAYVWEWAPYPQYYVPRADVRMELLEPDGEQMTTTQGELESYRFRTGDTRSDSARIVVSSPVDGLTGMVRFAWDRLDAWFEEDERVYVHPRNPYARVDALRSNRTVRVDYDGLLLAQTPTVVMVFETGLPTRYYIDRNAVDFRNLVPSETRTACPYKGRTTGYWSIRSGEKLLRDVAWSYEFPTRDLTPISGLVAFLNEEVDIVLDGVPLTRPHTHMSH